VSAKSKNDELDGIWGVTGTSIPADELLFTLGGQVMLEV
jgi:hypothetical protein